MENPIKAAVKYYYKSVFTGVSGTSASDWLDVSETGKYFGTVWDIIDPIYNAIVIIGIIFCLIWFYVEMIDRSTRNEATIEVFGKQAVMLVFAVFFISMGIPVLQGIASFGSELMEVASVPSEETTEALSKINEEIDEMGSFELLSTFITIIVGYLITLASNLVVAWASASRSINFFVYACLFPIGVADIYKNGGGSSGIRYVKKLCAISLQGAAILLIVRISSAIQGSVVLNTFTQSGGEYSISDIGTPVESFALMLAVMGAVLGSLKICDDVMGV